MREKVTMNNRASRLLLTVIFTMVTAGCTWSPNHPAPQAARPRTIRIGDELMIDIIEPTDLQVDNMRVANVDHDGNIQFPLLGKIPAAGMTEMELAEQIRKMIEANVDTFCKVDVKVERMRSAENK
jgi:protein involved in polysaccharide export with SLBB domain